MNEAEDLGEHVMQTRKRRRDYKSLEDGKDAVADNANHKNLALAQEKWVEKHHIISINTNMLKSIENSASKQAKSHPSPTHSNSKTSGRWTNEEHKKFIEALKKYGKQWKKVEEYIQTRSGAQIRSHAQKYFLKIQKEYPDQDSFEVFQTKTPEFLETTIFMKKRDSDDMSSDEYDDKNDHLQTPQNQDTHDAKEDPSIEFSQSVEKLLAKKRNNKLVEKSDSSLSESHQNDIKAIRHFYDHIKGSIPSPQGVNHSSKTITAEGKFDIVNDIIEKINSLHFTNNNLTYLEFKVIVYW